VNARTPLPSPLEGEGPGERGRLEGEGPGERAAPAAEELPTVAARIERHHENGVTAEAVALLDERPVGIVLNGDSYAVMMVTPIDLEDFALGFMLTEGIVRERDDVVGIEVHEQSAREVRGFNVYLQLAPDAWSRAKERPRNLPGFAGCGLCGARNLETALHALAPLSGTELAAAAIESARAALETRQPLNRATGAAHAAALLDATGQVAFVREDVGRHNALDKAIGAAWRANVELPQFAALVTSRASVELVEKCMTVGIAQLAAVSAPTALAVERARACGMVLWGYVRTGRATRYA